MSTTPAMTSAPLVLLGAGGHAAVVAESARRAGHAIAAIASATRPASDAVFGTTDWLGDPDDPAVERAIRARIDTGARVLLAVGDAALRARWSARFADAVAPAIVDPSATVSPSATLAEGVFIGAGAVVQARARIGAHAIVNTRAVVEHDGVLGAIAHVAPGAILCGGVSVGERAFVGAGAVVIPGRSIGADAVVGAGAVVVRDVPAGVTVRGVPAHA